MQYVINIYKYYNCILLSFMLQELHLSATITSTIALAPVPDVHNLSFFFFFFFFFLQILQKIKQLCLYHVLFINVN